MWSIWYKSASDIEILQCQPLTGDLSWICSKSCLSISSGCGTDLVTGVYWQPGNAWQLLSPENCYPSSQLLKYILASQREVLIVPSGKQLVNITHLSVFLSVCRGQVPIASRSTRIPFLLCQNDSFVQRRVCCDPAELAAHQKGETR